MKYAIVLSLLLSSALAQADFANWATAGGGVGEPSDHCTVPSNDLNGFRTWGNCERDRNVKNHVATITSVTPFPVHLDSRHVDPVGCYVDPSLQEAFSFNHAASDGNVLTIDNNSSLDGYCMARAVVKSKTGGKLVTDSAKNHFYRIKFRQSIPFSCYNGDWITNFFNVSGNLSEAGKSNFRQQLATNCFNNNTSDIDRRGFINILEATRYDLEPFKQYLTGNNLLNMHNFVNQEAIAAPTSDGGITAKTGSGTDTISNTPSTGNIDPAPAPKEDTSGYRVLGGGSSASQVQVIPSDRTPASEMISPTRVRFDLKFTH